MKIDINDLKQSNQFLNDLYENVTSAIFIADNDARIQSVNNSFKTLFYKEEDGIIQELCGNVIQCVYQVEEGIDCGQTSNCDDCILRQCILKSFIEKVPVYKQQLKREFYVDDSKIEKYFIFTTKYILYNNTPLILVIFDDVTELEEKRLRIEQYNDKLKDVIELNIKNLFSIQSKIYNLETQKDILLKEVHHRVGNNLQMISSLINIQCLKGKESKESFDEMNNRIRVMRSLYDNALDETLEGACILPNYIKTVVEILQKIFRNKEREVEIDYDLEEITCPIDIALSIGLYIYEVCSNSYKYAYDYNSKSKKAIRISLHKKNKIELEVSDNGCGFDPERFHFYKNNSVGMFLIDILIRQINADLTFEFSNGTKYFLTF